jgi:hypothetical protein
MLRDLLQRRDAGQREPPFDIAEVALRTDVGFVRELLEREPLFLPKLGDSSPDDLAERIGAPTSRHLDRTFGPDGAPVVRPGRTTGSDGVASSGLVHRELGYWMYTAGVSPPSFDEGRRVRGALPTTSRADTAGASLATSAALALFTP